MSDQGQLGPEVLENRTVRFSLAASDLSEVSVVGDFTEWHHRPLKMHRSEDGTFWTVETNPLSEGNYRYKFRSGDDWFHDPSHPLVEADGHGGWNSVIGVGGPSVGEENDLRILTLNLHTYQETDPLLKLEQIAYVCASLDVDALALQEVGEHWTDPARRNAGAILQDRLAELNGEQWYHHWRFAHPGFTFYHEGLSLLARAPLEDFVEHRLSEGRLSRNLLLATLNIKGLRLRLGCTHVTWPERGGVEEIQKLSEIFAKESTGELAGIILAGDFNALPDENHLRTLSEGKWMDIGGETGAVQGTWPVAEVSAESSPKKNLIREQSSIRALSCRIDYQFLSKVAAKLKAVTSVRVFDGETVNNVWQPIVSDHVGVLGVYRGSD